MTDEFTLKVVDKTESKEAVKEKIKEEIESDEFNLKIVDRTSEPQPEPKPVVELTPEEIEEKKKKAEDRERRKRILEEDLSHIPPDRFCQFCRNVKNDQLVGELVANYGVREPTAAQKVAGVKVGKYTAAEFNNALEKLAKKAGIRTRHASGEEIKEKEEPKELETIKLVL